VNLLVTAIILVVGILTAGILYAIYTEEEPVINDINEQSEFFVGYSCSGTAVCYVGNVTEVIDGDTLRIRGSPIRLALTSAPELSEEDGIKAKNFVAKLCPLGSKALVDQDDGQTSGSFGRMVAKVVCGSDVVNSRLLEEGLAEIDRKFCSISEFASEDWAKKYGCAKTVQEKKQTFQSSPSVQPMTTEKSCDPSYPDVCIPPFPPDLDCSEISHRNFKVLPADPHGFDGDNDGIGCEK